MAKDDFKYMFGLKMRMFPTHKQERIAKLNFGVARFVYNQLIVNSWTDSKITQVNKQYPQVKRNRGLMRIRHNGLYPWLKNKDIDSNNACYAERNYQAAWNMFKKVNHGGVPKFKKKTNAHQSYQTYSSYKSKVKGQESIFNGSIKFIDSNHIHLPKLGIVKVHNSVNLPTKQRVKIGTVTVSTDGLNYYVSMLIKSDKPLKQELAKTNSQIGIDLNLDNFLMTSNGCVVANPKYYRHAKKRLAKEQRILSRRQLRAKKEHRKLAYAKHYQEQKRKVHKLHTHVAKQRQDFLHNLSTALIKNHDLVVAEELRSSNMLKNHALAMAISDVGWRTFLTMLDYKAKMYGKQFITVNPKNTTQTCSDCGYIMKGEEHLGLDKREWTCPACHLHHIRDVNAAKNILAKGKLQLA